MNSFLNDRVAWTVSLLFFGIAAGAMVMSLFGYYPLLGKLADRESVQLHQMAVDMHRTLFRATIVGSGLTGALLIAFFSTPTARPWLIGSLACLAILIIFTNLAIAPLNQQIEGWNTNELPPHWKVSFAQMIARERLRSILPVLAFVFALIAARR